MEIRPRGHLVTVDDRHASSFAVGVVFAPETSERERRELVLDLNDPQRNAVLTRSLRSFEVNPAEPLLATIREFGFALKRR